MEINMEQLVLWMPMLFCYVTGIIIAWSGFILQNYISIWSGLTGLRRTHRTNDVITAGTISAVMIILGMLLFVVPQVVSPIMDLTLVLELWYAAFLTYVTNKSTISMLNIRSIKNSTTFVSGPPPRNPTTR